MHLNSNYRFQCPRRCETKLQGVSGQPDRQAEY